MLRDPVGERRARVTDRRRGDPQAVDVPCVALDLLEDQPGVDPLERHREIRRREIRGDLLLEAPVGRPRAVDLDRRLRIEQEREEPEPFDVVEMQMCQEQVDLVERLLGERVPRSRMPVPASSTTTAPPALRTSRHVVLPPYRTVVSPGVASEPRHPQIRAFIAGGTVDEASGAPLSDRLRSPDGAAPQREGRAAEDGAALRALLEEGAGGDRSRSGRARAAGGAGPRRRGRERSRVRRDRGRGGGRAAQGAEDQHACATATSSERSRS